jgi:transposase-like protein
MAPAATSADHEISCPICEDGKTGVPYEVTVGGGYRTVSFRCPACRRIWSERQMTTKTDGLMTGSSETP